MKYSFASTYGNTVVQLLRTSWFRSTALQVLLALVCLGSASGQSNNLKFEHITSEKGLPQSTIHGIVKDKYGFMWFGTWGGLCKFDGYKFTIYRYDPANNRSISDNRIHNLVKDENQDIWVLPFGEEILCRYNYQTDDFDRIPVDQVSPQFMSSISRRDHYLNASATYNNTRWHMDSWSNSLAETHLPTNQQKFYEYNPANRWTLNDPYVTDIYKDDHNMFWVGTYSNGINKANLNAKPFDYVYHDPRNAKSIIDNNIRAICEDNNGNLWIGTRDKGITIIDKKNNYKHLTYKEGDASSISSNQIKKIFCDSRGYIWIGTKKGLDGYNPATGKIRHYEGADLKKTTVHGIMEDRSGNIWLASWKGAYKYLVNKDSLIRYDLGTSLKVKHARVIIEDSAGQIWVGTEGAGLMVLKPSATTEAVQVVDQATLGLDPNYFLTDNRINSLYEDKAGLIWIGTGKGLHLFNPKTKKQQYLSAATDLPETAIAGIAEDEAGFVWVSHKKGISRINRKTLAVSTYSLQDGLQSNEFSDGAIFKSATSNKLYIGGNNGYNVFNPAHIKPDATLPRIVLTELQILNQPVTVNSEVNGRVVLNKPLYLTENILLTHQDKSIALEFAALHYANPDGNRYAYMLEGFDKDWIFTDASRRLATYSNLAPGNYTFKVKASNSDGVWNPVPATLQLEVKPPFWASSWAYGLYAFLILLALYLLYYFSARYTNLKNRLSYELLIREKEHELHQNKLQFFTNISHEIKTPLTLLLAPVDRLLHAGINNDLVNSQLQTMKTNGDRLLRLINQLLDFRRLETGHTELMLKKYELITFLSHVVEPFRAFADEKNLQLQFHHQDQALFMSFDEDKLEKVINNLLSNAFKFTPSGGTIKLEAGIALQGDQVFINVSNTGKGIPESEKNLIFEPFQQGSSNRTGGTGIGLTYSKGLVELHGGTLTVESAAQGDKQSLTCFTITLPLNTSPADSEADSASLHTSKATVTNPAQPESESEAHADQEQLLVQGKTPSLLLVEDNDDLRRYLCDYFESQYLIVEARNGKEGMELASKVVPDIIISDVMMPEMDGFELCKKIKTDLKTSHIPFILLTAKAPIESQIEGIETGADDYIVKPFNLAFLETRVKNLLRSRERLREKYKTEITLEPSAVNPVSPDEKLLKKLLQYVEDRIADTELNVDAICSEVGLSRTHLYRKVKSLTGFSMAELIKELRLKRAMQLLKDRKFNVNEVADMVGFSDADYFRKCFKVKFKVTPSEYYKSINKEEFSLPTTEIGVS